MKACAPRIHVVIKMADQNKLCFSPGSEYLAYSSPDGIIKIWETSTGVLKQEYIPASHLSTTCTCLSWSCGRYKTGPPRKKRRSEIGQEAGEIDYLAIGTSSGSILIYSMLQASVHTELRDGHSNEVNCICWDEASDSLYSCSNDNHISCWSINTGKIKFKWKADRGNVYSICLTPDKRHLISASRKIKWWNLETQQLLKTFTGHATEVRKLFYVPLKNDASLSKQYFISAAVDDKLLSVWQLSESESRKSCVASFSLSDEPAVIDVSQAIEDEPIFVTGVTKYGTLHLFEQHFNGKCQTSTRPRFTLQIVTQSNAEDIPKPLPILAACFCNDSRRNIMVTYGSLLRPMFEKIPFQKYEKETCLIREDPSRVSVKTSQSISNIKTPTVPMEAKYLAFHQLNSHLDGSSKKQLASSSIQEMSIEERLKVVDITRTHLDNKELPTADSMVQLIKQGLQSNDLSILGTVLNRSEEVLISNTVKRLPSQYVLSLLQVLSKTLLSDTTHNQACIRWLRSILSNHLSFLVSCPGIVDMLNSIYCTISYRVGMFEKMSRLQGKIDLLLTQIIKSSHGINSETENFFQIESSESEDEDDKLDDLVLTQSESESNWSMNDDEQSNP